jgi:hypothetical protein
MLRPGVRLNPWSPRTAPGFTSHDGSKFIKIYFQWMARRFFPPTAFPLSCAGRDKCRQSAEPWLALDDCARYMTVENPDITQGEAARSAWASDRQGSGAATA